MPSFLCRWDSSTKPSHLTDLEAHVWCAPLDHSVDQLTVFSKLLAPEEEDRASRFYFAKDRDHFIAARGILRLILSYYLACEPQSLCFHYNAYGKPELISSIPLQFNLSHSENIALYAITRKCAVGVDIEYMKADCEIDALAQRFFSPQESHLLQRLTGQTKVQAFFNGWTRKEAFLKALGEGLSYPLKQVEVSMVPEQPATFIALHDKNQDSSQWSLYALDPIPGFAAALAVKGHLQEIKTWRWDNFNSN